MTTPQWEACKVCGGDHWTKDHTTLEGHRICEENMDAEIARQAAEIATLRALSSDRDALTDRLEAAEDAARRFRIALDGLVAAAADFLADWDGFDDVRPSRTGDALRTALAALATAKEADGWAVSSSPLAY